MKKSINKLSTALVLALVLSSNIANAFELDNVTRGLTDTSKVRSCMEMCDDMATDPSNTTIGGITAYAACMAGCMSVKSTTRNEERQYISLK